MLQALHATPAQLHNFVQLLPESVRELVREDPSYFHAILELYVSIDPMYVPHAYCVLNQLPTGHLAPHQRMRDVMRRVNNTFALPAHIHPRHGLAGR